MRKIVIENYNIEWIKEFDVLKRIYIQHMKHLNIDVQHVGSTSVPGCAAKPVLDIDIIIDDIEKLSSVFSILNKLGYIHLGDLGIKGREAFKRISIKVPYCNNQDYQFEHNLYVCIASSLSLENHLRFRDYLRKNREAVFEYWSAPRSSMLWSHGIHARVLGHSFINGENRNTDCHSCICILYLKRAFIREQY